MDIPSTKRSPNALIEGLSAGLGLFASDWIASDPRNVPAALVGLSLTACLALGFAAGAAAGLLRRPGAALGALVGFGSALNVVSLASKDLAPSTPVLVVVILSMALLGVLAVVIGAARPRLHGLAAHLPFVTICGGGLLWSVIPHGLPALALLAVLPLLPLAFLDTRPGKPLRADVAGAAGYVLLALPWLTAPAPDLPLSRPPSEAKAAPGAPNVLLVVVDTLRADVVTPERHGALGRLAREGVYFEQALSSAPWTLPAVSSLMTGLHPSQHGAVSSRIPLPAEVTTVAERFRDAGYATAAFTGGAFVGPAHRLDQGFEHFDPFVERGFPAFRRYVPLLWRLAKSRFLPLYPIVAAVDEYAGLYGAVEAVRAWETPRDRPFFLFVHSYQVHDYYLYDPTTDDAIRKSVGMPERFAGRFSVHPDELQHATVDELAWFRAIYDARLWNVERSLEELLHHVRLESGERELVVAFTSDHGEGFDAARGRVHHGGRLHDDLLRVPLILQAPGLEPRRVDAQVRTLDLAPTLLELAGLEPLEGIAGVSLLAGLRGGSFPEAAFAEEWEHGAETFSVRKDGWKWIRSRAGDEVYEVRLDPGEYTRLDRGPEALRTTLEAFRAAHPLRTASEAVLDPATALHLRELGYTDGDEGAR